MTLAILLKHHNIPHNPGPHWASGRPHETYPETVFEEIMAISALMVFCELVGAGKAGKNGSGPLICGKVETAPSAASASSNETPL
jgi:hypothetical protein